MARSSRALFSVLAIAAVGCKSTESVVEEHKEAATAKLQALETIAADAKQRPKIRSVTLESKPEGSLELRKTGFDTGVIPLYVIEAPCEREYFWGDSGAGANAIRLHHTSIPSSPDVWFRDPACLVAKGRPAPGSSSHGEAERIEKRFGMLEGLEHVFVLRYHDYRPPKVLGSEVSGTTYTPGRAQGDLLLYHVDDRAWLGGVPLDVSSSDETGTNPNAAINSSIDAVLADFRSNIDASIRETIREHLDVAAE